MLKMGAVWLGVFTHMEKWKKAKYKKGADEDSMLLADETDTVFVSRMPSVFPGDIWHLECARPKDEWYERLENVILFS